MAFRILRNDITKVRAEAIVNTANPQPVIGSGTDSTIYEAAGRAELFQARLKIGNIERGQSAWTPSFKLKKNGVKYIIHTVGVHYNDGNHGEKEILRSCYSTALKMAVELKCKSVAIPFLATGNYEFPKEVAFQIAVEEISCFLLSNEIDVFLVVYDDEAYKISEKLFYDVEDFLSDNFEGDELKNCDVCASEIQADYCSFEEPIVPVGSVPSKRSAQVFSKKLRTSASSAIVAEKQAESVDVEAFINTSKEKLNFQNTLQQLIAERNMDNASIYKKACIDKKFFSKIISNKDYIPKKHTVMALGLALELPLAEYEDFLKSAGYAFMPSSRFDLIIKFCVINRIYNIYAVDIILDDHGEKCFAPN